MRSAFRIVAFVSPCLLLPCLTAAGPGHRNLPRMILPGCLTTSERFSVAITDLHLNMNPALRIQIPKSPERERQAASAEFKKNFSGLQNAGYKLLKEHEAGRLNPKELEKGVKTVNRHARTLREMMLLGELEEPIQESDDPINTPGKFDQSIRRLARLIYTFAHNPLHQERRVFDTVKARRALIDLETIIVLSKAIEGQARNYAAE